MILFRLLPWEYSVRNLFRRPLRTALTEAGFVSTPRGLRLHSGPGRR